MKLERLSCGAVVDTAGRVFPDRVTARRYAEWQPGAGCLGADWRSELESLVDERLCSIHDLCADSPEAIFDFLASVDLIRRDLWRRIGIYESFCTQFRAERGMRAFCWSLESRESVQAAFRDVRGRPALPGKPEAVAARREAYYATEPPNYHFEPSAVLDEPAPVDWRGAFGLSEAEAEDVIFNVLHTWNVGS